MKSKTVIIAESISNFESYRNAVNVANWHNYLYFIKNEPEIEDYEFDYLVSKIEEYEKQNPDEQLNDSPTLSAASDLHSSDHTIPHRKVMLSLNKCNEIEAVRKWMQETSRRIAKKCKCNADEIKYIGEWKFDGVSCSLVYQDGILVSASTRGDTHFGKDISVHCMSGKIQGIPQELVYGVRDSNQVFVPSARKYEGRVEIRGEILMAFDNLKETSYTDTRSAASAILNTDFVTTMDHLLQFKAWELVVDDLETTPNLTSGSLFVYNSLIAMYHEMGFDLEDVCVTSLDSLEEDIRSFANLRKDNPFPTDGIVFKVENKTTWDILGCTQKAPRYAIAYKFPSKTAVTYVTDIERREGEKTGKVTFNVYYTPVTINGRTNRVSSIGSEATMRRLGIYEGAKIVVRYANDANFQISGLAD